MLAFSIFQLTASDASECVWAVGGISFKSRNEGNIFQECFIIICAYISTFPTIISTEPERIALVLALKVNGFPLFFFTLFAAK